MADSRSSSILDELTEPQRRAVTYGEGPLLVVAGAGSGKTRVITRRIAYLVEEDVPPERIIGITFTNKAADEMRLRVERLAGESVTVSTFHSLCARILRRNAQKIGLDPSFSIYDTSDSRRVARQIRNDMDLDRETYTPAGLLDDISAWKDEVLPPSRAMLEAVGHEEEKAAEVYRRYEEQLKANNALDFDDLLVKTVQLFSEAPEVLRHYQDRYHHVLVDEYQDTNLPQHLIAKGLQGKHHNITAVGDPDQMIYTWRGARIENIMEFEEDFPDAEVILLEQNYRSTSNILNAASYCIQHNRMRHEKALWTQRDGGPPVRVQQFPDGRAEARWIKERLAELRNKGVKPGEIAVLYRTKYQAFQLEKELVNGPIPYQVVDTVGFFDRKAVKDLRAYLRLIINPDDDEAFRRIVNVPSRGIGKKTLERINNLAHSAGLSLGRAVRKEDLMSRLPTRARGAVQRFRRVYDRLRELDQDSIRTFIKNLIQEIDYISSANEDERDDVREVLDQFVGFADQYDSDNPDGSLIDFMEDTALMSDIDGWNPRADAVSLMTLHSAKGLEFDVVFISGLEEDILPHQRALEDNAHGDGDIALEEERRLFHVGMTRARDRLYITHCGSRYMHGRSRPMSPSRFLDELPEDGVQRVRTQSQSAGAGLFRNEVKKARRKKRRTRRSRTSKDRSAGAQSGKSAPSTGGSPLQVIGDGEDISAGATVQHEGYGQGEVVNVDSAGKYHQVRVNFEESGVLTILIED
ncbi:MAG: ATP-dependent helicase [Planctomycetota bacterium]